MGDVEVNTHPVMAHCNVCSRLQALLSRSAYLSKVKYVRGVHYVKHERTRLSYHIHKNLGNVPVNMPLVVSTGPVLAHN